MNTNEKTIIAGVELTRLSKKAYQAARSKFDGAKANAETNLFFSFLYSATAEYVESENVEHLNRALSASFRRKADRMGLRILGAVSPHKYDKDARKFVGKADKTKLDALRADWHGVFIAAFEKEMEHQSTPPVWDWSKKKAALIRIVRQAAEHNIPEAEVLAVFAEGLNSEFTVEGGVEDEIKALERHLAA